MKKHFFEILCWWNVYSKISSLCKLIKRKLFNCYRNFNKTIYESIFHVIIVSIVDSTLLSIHSELFGDERFDHQQEKFSDNIVQVLFLSINNRYKKFYLMPLSKIPDKRLHFWQSAGWFCEFGVFFYLWYYRNLFLFHKIMGLQQVHFANSSD